MKKMLFVFLPCCLASISLSNSPHWLVEIDCEDNLNFFEIFTEGPLYDSVSH